MATLSVIRQAESPVLDAPHAGLLEQVQFGLAVSVEAGRTIVVEGDPIDYVYRILSGSVRLYKAVADGRRQIIDFLGPQDCFGLTGFDRHAYSVEPITDVTLTRYKRKRLEAAIKDQPELGHQLFRLACYELNRAQQSMLLLGRKSADERVASFLLDLIDRRNDDDRKDVSLQLAMSRQDIADHLGLTIETVSRIFTRLKRAGLISLQDRHTVILTDITKLSRIADGELYS